VLRTKLSCFRLVFCYSDTLTIHETFKKQEKKKAGNENEVFYAEGGEDGYLPKLTAAFL